MAEALSISKSVARAFEVLELFRTERQPLTAAAISRRLTLPQPSTRALLKTLVSLGYLACTESDRRYWPTGQLTALGEWLTAEPHLPAALIGTLERIVAKAGETTSLCGLRDGHVDILCVRKARHPVAVQLETGLGAEAWRTAVGRALLASLPEASAAALSEGWLSRERSAAGRRVLQGLPQELKRAHTAGFLAGYDLFLPGVGAVCVPVPSARQEAGPRVVAVAGLSQRIRPRQTTLLRLIRAELP